MKWRDKINRKYMQISLYVIITALIIYSLIKLENSIPVIVAGFITAFDWLIRVIKPLIIGFAFAYLMDPVVCFFEESFRKSKLFKKVKHPRTGASVISVALLAAVFVGLISMLVFSVTNQLRLANFDDIIRIANGYIDGLNKFITSVKVKMDELNIQSQELKEYLTTASTFIVTALTNIAKSVVSSITNISSYMTTIIFSFIIGFYFMIDGKSIKKFFKQVFEALFPDRFNHALTSAAHDLDEVFSGYIRGQLTDAFVMLILISLTLTVTGVKYAIVIGILTGIGNLIPYLGPIVAYISTAIACLFNGDIKTLIISIIALAVIQFIDGNLINPKLLSRSIKIHPLIIIISLIFGNAIGGFLGMLLAVPVGAYIKLVFVRFIDRRTKRKEEQKKEAMINGK